jgi:hypothetical protein
MSSMSPRNRVLLWAWTRHHNVLSWYVRPLFILPYCWFASRHHLPGMVATLLLLPTSLAWFPAPKRVDPSVGRYLAQERTLLAGDRRGIVAFVALVAGFLVSLGAAFWRRSWGWGLAVLNLGTLLKLAWGFVAGEGSGRAAVAPALATLAICDAAVAWAIHRMQRLGVQSKEARE